MSVFQIQWHTAAIVSGFVNTTLRDLSLGLAKGRPNLVLTAYKTIRLQKIT
jgi:hypothetical protein